jgi:hypothetical protein
MFRVKCLNLKTINGRVNMRKCKVIRYNSDGSVGEVKYYTTGPKGKAKMLKDSKDFKKR